MRIVVAPDKFKGTLSAFEAARAMAAGVAIAMPSAEVVVVAVSDGGEGFSTALLSHRGGETHNVSVRGPLGGPVAAPIGYLADCVVLESARACGLGVVRARDPLRASSTGVGDLVRHALEDPHPPAAIVVGVGGTASTDGGTGAASALGWRFLDAAGDELSPGGAPLVDLHAVDAAGVDTRLGRQRVLAACDVANPLVGPSGSAAVFAPQKGASPHDVVVLERGLERLADVVSRDLGMDVAGLTHGGSGGGLGAGLAAFFGAELVSGFDYVARQTRLEDEIERADVVLTGEGRLDASTGRGKVVAGVVRLAHAAGARPVVVAGEIGTDAPVSITSSALCAGLLDRFGDAARVDAVSSLTTAVSEVLATV